MKILKYLKNPLMILVKLDLLNIISLSDKLYLKIVYKYRTDKRLNLVHPKSFNEKLQWLKLYDRKDIYTTMVDKYDVKKYVANIIGDEYIIPTLGIYNSFDEIDFDKLPNQFVIKCTHDSGGLVVVKDKNTINIDMVKKKVEKTLNNDYYKHGREWPYKNIKPRIIIEKYMEDRKTKELRDYKFFCFNGKVQFFKIDFDRFINHRANYYDLSGNLLPFGELVCLPDENRKIDMPVNLNQMVNFASKLSHNIPFLRVDFYEIDNRIYFGELTFFPANGFGKFVPNEWDDKIGEYLKLPIKNHNFCSQRGITNEKK